MGYQPVTPKTPGRRPLKRLRLESSENSSPRQSKPPDLLSTPVKLKMSSPEEKLIATRINDSDEHFIEHEQCKCLLPEVSRLLQKW